MRTRVARALAATCLTAFVMGMAAVPTAAVPIDKGKFHDVFSEVREECDLNILYEEDVQGRFLVNSRGRDGLVYFSSTVRGTQSWTNLATDKSYSTVFNGVDKDQRVTDNGDGTLTILVLVTGNETWYGPDGNVLFRNPGQVRFELLVDHGGTPSDPSDDEFLEFLGVVKGSTGRNDLEGRDFCDDLREFTA
jgi:hypothetical protein